MEKDVDTSEQKVAKIGIEEKTESEEKIGTEEKIVGTEEKMESEEKTETQGKSETEYKFEAVEKAEADAKTETQGKSENEDKTEAEEKAEADEKTETEQKTADRLSRIKLAGGVSMFGPTPSLKESISEPSEKTKEVEMEKSPVKKIPPPIPSKGSLSRTNSGISKNDQDAITHWVAETSQTPLPESGDLWSYLQDGVVLCKVVNALAEKSGKKGVKINTGKFAQQQMVRNEVFFH